MIKAVNKYELNSKLLSNKENKKTINTDEIEDKDEYLVINDISIQEIQNKKLKFSDKTNIVPIKVATPLPPLNFSQIGKMCPKKEARADK